MNELPHQKLIKMQGTGNDFLVADFRTPGGPLEELINSQPRPEWARQLCSRHFNIGADGLVILEPPQEPQDFDFQWDFYNSDGSPAEMCGNAARCITLWVSEEEPEKAQWTFKTQAGAVRSWMKGSTPCVQMTDVVAENRSLEENFQNQSLSLQIVNSGVPHALVVMDWQEHTAALKDWCQKLFEKKAFGPQGANITFLYPTDKKTIAAVTFERGVEDFTLSCGTGATAAAWWAHHHLGLPSRVNVQVPGGPLEVEISPNGPVLCGAAVLVAELWPLADPVEVKEVP